MLSTVWIKQVQLCSSSFLSWTVIGINYWAYDALLHLTENSASIQSYATIFHCHLTSSLSSDGSIYFNLFGMYSSELPELKSISPSSLSHKITQFCRVEHSSYSSPSCKTSGIGLSSSKIVKLSLRSITNIDVLLCQPLSDGNCTSPDTCQEAQDCVSTNISIFTKMWHRTI